MEALKMVQKPGETSHELVTYSEAIRVIVGIDLGTTHSLVAVWREERAQLIPNVLGECLTPSCVGLDEDGTILVGRAARERLQTHPKLTTAGFKRFMGSDHLTHLGDRSFRAEELSSFVLRSLKADAEAFLGHPVDRVIVTVPAYFSDAQRKATVAAARLAGLRVEALLNEPTAAALAQGVHLKGRESKFLVFDLGGGTFDVSILDLFEGVMEVRATSGDNFLGGDDFTEAIQRHFVNSGKVPSEAAEDPLFMSRFRSAMESLKRDVGAMGGGVKSLPYQGGTLQLEMSLEEFAEVSSGLLKRLRTPVERAIRDADLEVSELDAIVLAGGATRMPMVRDLVQRMFGRPGISDLNPDEVVALGAAVQAGLHMKDKALSEVVMTDVSPYSLGVEVSLFVDGAFIPGHFDPIIERNTVIPTSRVKTYAPTHDGQRQLRFRIFQGEARLAKENIPLGEIRMDLTSFSRQENSFDVRFTYDVNGLLEVEAKHCGSNETKRLVIQGNTGVLSEAEIDARIKALSYLKIHPRDRMENRTLIAKAERVYSMLKGPTREAFGFEIARFEALLAGQDEPTIRKGRGALEHLTDRLENELALEDGPIQ